MRRLLPAFASLLLISYLFADDCTKNKTVRAPIGNIQFLNDSLLSPDAEDEIVRSPMNTAVCGRTARQELDNVADQAAERTRHALQNIGYFKVQVEGNAIPAQRHVKKYDVVIRILDPGKQYRLGELTVINARRFPTQQLIHAFPIRRGDIFSREKIEKGLQALQILYGAQGYINYTGLPKTQVDESAIINLTIDVDEGKQFRWGNLHLEGMREQDAEFVLKAWERLLGELYGSGDQQLNSFFSTFFYPLRQGTSMADYLRLKVDELTATVDVYLSLVLNPEILREATKTGTYFH